MLTKLRMKCKNCGHWHSMEVEKLMLNPDCEIPKVQVFIPHFLPLKQEKCTKCGSIIAEERELIRIIKQTK